MIVGTRATARLTSGEKCGCQVKARGVCRLLNNGGHMCGRRRTTGGVENGLSISRIGNVALPRFPGVRRMDQEGHDRPGGCRESDSAFGCGLTCPRSTPPCLVRGPRRLAGWVRTLGVKVLLAFLRPRLGMEHASSDICPRAATAGRSSRW